MVRTFVRTIPFSPVRLLDVDVHQREDVVGPLHDVDVLAHCPHDRLLVQRNVANLVEVDLLRCLEHGVALRRVGVLLALVGRLSDGRVRGAARLGAAVMVFAGVLATLGVLVWHAWWVDAEDEHAACGAVARVALWVAAAAWTVVLVTVHLTPRLTDGPLL